MADPGREGARAVESPEFEDYSVGFDAVERDHLTGVRLIPIDAEEVVLTHPGYDTERAQTDLDVVYPVPSLRRSTNSRVIGSVAPTIVSTMGFVPDGRRVLERTVPPALDALLAEEVDLVLLVPA